MHTIHLVAHTHWDREWYRPFQLFRLRLVHLVDGLLDLLANDLAYQHFMLDGQTIVLDDYLQIRPEAEAALKQHIQSGRLLIGPWHILPDMFLVSPEAHVRNLLEGDRQARRFGGKMMIGYMPDSFGHIGQMPQILRGFGIDSACVWRGLDDQPAEFWWQAPDGSRVLMLYLRDSYSNGAGLNTRAPVEFTEQVRRAADSLVPHSAASDLLIMYGTDHMEPPPETTMAITFANECLQDYCVVHSTLPGYLASIQSQVTHDELQLPTVIGELRSSRRSHLLPGVLSTRMWIKQRNHACENLLEKWAEPFSLFASLANGHTPGEARIKRPSSAVHLAWRQLMECHPHDSICGCSIDQVHDEMKPRFDQVEQIGEEITHQSLDALAGAVNTQTAKSATACRFLSAVVVFNPLSASRTDVVTSDIVLPPDVSEFQIVDERGEVVPHQSASGKTTDLISLRVRREELGDLLNMVHEGRAENLAIQDVHFDRDGVNLRVDAVFAENAEPDLKVWEAGSNALRQYLEDASIEFFHIRARTPESSKVSFTAKDVPGLGWRSFHVRSCESGAPEVELPWALRLLAPLGELPFVQKLLRRFGERPDKPPYSIANDSLSVELDPADSTLTVIDKRTRRLYAGLNRFVDSGDCGDTYNFSPPPNDSREDRPRLHSVHIVRGPVQERMTVSLVLSVPASLSEDRKSRSRERVELPITTTIAVTYGVPRVDIHTQVENRARDHRLRVHFPASFQVQGARYDGHFEIVNRAVGIPSFDDTWIEQPRPEVPQRAFTSITDGTAALTIANRGLPEVEVLQSAHGASSSEIALTLLRCVGWLSRDDFTTRRGHAGPLLETPLAQMPGKWDFDYSIIPAGDASASHQLARGFDAPLRAAATGIHDGSLASSGSFLQTDNPSFVVTAVKEAEDGRGWIVRGHNIGADEIPVTLRAWRRFPKAERTDLAEQAVGELKVEETGEVAIRVKGHEIATVLFTE